MNGRDLEDWKTPTGSASADTIPYLRKLIDRSRSLWRDNDYVKGYGRHLRKSILHSRGGAQGIILQNRAVSASGAPNDRINNLIEEAWDDFCLPGNCDVTRRHSMADLISIAAVSEARDGMVLIRLIPGFQNSHGFAVQLLDVDYLDLDYTGTNQGRRVIGGVELDEWGAPAAYWLRTDHPGAGMYAVRTPDGRGTRVRVPASELIAFFEPSQPEQYHGVPAFHASLARLRHLGRYEEAEVVSARVGAAQMGFFTREEGAGYTGQDLLGTDEEEGAESPEIIREASPGMFEELPPGVDFKAFSPSHPNAALPEFVRHMLRGSGAGVSVSYGNFANDASQATFASMRQSELNERDHWMLKQESIAVHMLTPIFMPWARLRVLDPAFPVPASKMMLSLRPTWHGKRWQWIDPLKEANATRVQVLELRSKTVGDAIAEAGGDFQDTMERWRRELAVMNDVFPKPEPAAEPVLIEEEGEDAE